jgi:hypothetical protein
MNCEREEKRMKIMEMTKDDIFRGWSAYEADEEALKTFILTCPAARAAHDGAVAAMQQGDERARSTWEGFLRALFVCAVKSGEVQVS